MDPQLVIQAQRGDEAAFAAITESVYVRLRSVAYRILRDPHLAEDATQQALLGIWRKLPRLRDPSRFDAWSYRFLVNACADEARLKRRALPVLIAPSEPVAADEVAAVDDREQLERGFGRLSMEHRVVIVLHHYLGMSVSDIADALDIPAGTVRSRLDRAMANLRLALRAGPPAVAYLPQEATP
jgi:RNA polymerase sigma-70 factor (ECF subfamily)